jgi:hypothetical protein
MVILPVHMPTGEAYWSVRGSGTRMKGGGVYKACIHLGCADAYKVTPTGGCQGLGDNPPPWVGGATCRRVLIWVVL